MASESIKFERSGQLALISLNRPDVLNSFNREMALALQESLRQCDADEEVRAIYITGEGRAFCAGQDLEEAISKEGPELQAIVAEHYNPIIALLRHIEKPIVCFVNGVAAGAGANIAWPVTSSLHPGSLPSSRHSARSDSSRTAGEHIPYQGSSAGRRPRHS